VTPLLPDGYALTCVVIMVSRCTVFSAVASNILPLMTTVAFTLTVVQVVDPVKPIVTQSTPLSTLLTVAQSASSDTCVYVTPDSLA